MKEIYCFTKGQKGKQKVFVQLMKCRVYCKHESFVSSEIGIKIVIIKYNIVNSLFIALKMKKAFCFKECFVL